MPLTFRPPLTEIPPSLLQVGIIQDNLWIYDALSAQHIAMLAWDDDAQQVYHLALAATPNAKLEGGPDPATPYHMADPVSPGTLRFRRETVAETPRPWGVRGTYKGQPVFSYIAGLIAEYDPAAGKDKLGVAYYGNMPVYTWTA